MALRGREPGVDEAATSAVTRIALVVATALAMLDLSIGGLVSREVSLFAMAAVLIGEVVGGIEPVQRRLDRLSVSLVGVLLVAISMPFTSGPVLVAASLLLGMGWRTVGRSLAPLFTSVFLVLIASTRVPIDEHLPFLFTWGSATVLALVGINRDTSAVVPSLEATTSLAPRSLPTGPPGVRSQPVRDLAVLLAGLVLVVPVLTAVLARAPGGPPARRGDASHSAEAYWGFESELDTGVRGALGDEVVMRVRSAAPELWRGQTFDTWDGRTWSRGRQRSLPLAGDLIEIPPGLGDIDPDRAEEGVPTQALAQTVTIDRGGNDLAFAAYRAAEIDLPVDRATWFEDGSLRLPRPLGKGSVYTVTSFRPIVTADLLRSHDPLDTSIPPSVRDGNVDAGALSDEARALGRQIAAGSPTTYDAILAMERWMGEHLTYTRDIPPLPPGADTVDTFLFQDRRGFCEQIATVLALWLRDLGVPARIAAGYAPDEQNPITGEWVVRERDAHAWVEVYFPGIGWQGFDPTSAVPLSGVSEVVVTGGPAALATLVGKGLLAAAGTVALVALAFAAVGRLSRRHRAPGTDRDLALVLARRLEGAGARRGLARDPTLTIVEYGERLRAVVPDDRVTGVARSVSDALFGRPDRARLTEATAELDEVLRDHPPPSRRGRRSGRGHV